MPGEPGDLLQTPLGDDHQRRLERRIGRQLTQPVEALRCLLEQAAAGVELVQHAHRADVRPPERPEHRTHRAEVGLALFKSLGSTPGNLVVTYALVVNGVDKVFDQAAEQLTDGDELPYVYSDHYRPSFTRTRFRPTYRLGNQAALAYAGQPDHGDRTVATGAEHPAGDHPQFGLSPDEPGIRPRSTEISIRIEASRVGHPRRANNQSLNSPTRRR